MKSYLCANRHHFTSRTPRCPSPGCTAEVRPTAMDPSTDGGKPSFEKLPRLAGQPPVPEPVASAKHSTRWWAYVEGQRSRRTSAMADSAYLWDATCSCGWDSDTGGDTMGNVDKLVLEHKR